MKTDMPRSQTTIRCMNIESAASREPQGKSTATSRRPICPALADSDLSESTLSKSAFSHSNGARTPAQRARKKKHDDQLLDETLEETFPASDAPSSGHIT